MSKPDRLAHLAAARAKAQEMRSARAKSMPRCTRTVEAAPEGLRKPGASTDSRTCGTITTQNEVERDRGIYWCPRCQRYPFGNGLRADKVPASAWPA